MFVLFLTAKKLYEEIALAQGWKMEDGESKTLPRDTHHGVDGKEGGFISLVTSEKKQFVWEKKNHRWNNKVHDGWIPYSYFSFRALQNVRAGLLSHKGGPSLVLLQGE